MEKLIEESQCFLFTVVCGGTDNVAYDWAQKAGAPVSFSQAKTPQGLLRDADYLVIKKKNFLTFSKEILLIRNVLI